MDKRSTETMLLKKLRGHMAYQKGVEPFKVFRDAELELLLDARPKTLEELSQVKGFPMEGKRVQGYGKAIVSVFNRSEDIEDFEVVARGEDIVVNTVLKPLKAF